VAKRIRLKDRIAQNESLCKSEDYQKALDLAESGKFTEALDVLEKFQQSSPRNAELMNDIGAILHCMHRSDEAIEYFQKANELQPRSAEILWNLSETYLAEGQPQKAAELFDEMNELGILNAEVLTRASEKLVNAGNLQLAVDTLKKSLEISPGQPRIPEMIEMISSQIEKNKNSD
jgi:Flp pilus assembly protein TadD